MASSAKPERKTRRTHKNSRDGCPNCRAKRIKCTEELPSCSNCIKKHYRCGYLDFPKERLEHIRRKNELKRQQAHYNNSEEVSTSSTLVGDDGAKKVAARSISDGLRHEHPAEVEQPNNSVFTDRSENFRSTVYSTVFSHLNGQDISRPIREMQPNSDELKPWQDISDIFKSEGPNLGVPSWPSNSGKSAENTPGFHEPHLDIKIETPDFDTVSKLNDNSLPGGTTPNTGSEPDLQEKSSAAAHDEFKSGQQRLRPSPIARRGSPLPFAIHKMTRFTRNTVPPYLENPFLKSAFQRSRTGKISVRDLSNDKFTSIIQPVWNEEACRQFWITIFHQASILNLYFVYFIDKSVNICKRTAQIVVNNEFDISNRSSVGSSSASSSPVSNTSLTPSSTSQGLADFFYNPDDLKRLNRLSYLTYGRLLRALRESIMNYHEEYPIKMSMFSAWACFWNASSDISTLTMMFTGALTLANRLLSQAQTINDVCLAVRQEMMILNIHASASVFPDFSLNAINELAHSFRNYKRIVSDLFYNHENGLAKFDPVTVNVLQNPLFKNNIHELSTFLKKLLNEYIPQIKAINTYFKNINGDTSISENIRFASPTLLYNLMFDWFRIFRGDKFSMVPNTSIIHRTLCLFFHALGRCMAQCITPIRSILLLDPNNVVAPKVGFSVPEPKFERFSDFENMYQIDVSLVRIIRYFEYRQALYGFYIGHDLVSDFLQDEPHQAPPDLEYKDIIRLSNEKISVAEVHPSSLVNGNFFVQNYPIFETISRDVECYHRLKVELDRQNTALQTQPWTFDYTIGLSNHDFQPQHLLEAYVRKRQAESMTDISPGLEELRKVSEHFTKSGKELIKCIKKGRTDTTDSE